MKDNTLLWNSQTVKKIMNSNTLIWNNHILKDHERQNFVMENPNIERLRKKILCCGIFKY